MSLLTVAAGAAAETIAVGAASAQFALTLDAGKAYRLISSTACYVAQGANPTAVAGAGTGRYYVPAGVALDLHGFAGVKVAVIQAAAGGFASIAALQWH